MIKKNTIILLIFFILVGVINTQAQEKSAEELAKMAQNPLANMMSFPLQNNTTFGNGLNSDRTSNVLNIQPVLPFFNGHLITRTIIPIVSTPDYTKENGATTGVGDINMSLFYSPTSKNELTWGIGPVFVIPTGSDMSSHKFSTGATFLLLKMSKKFVYGFLVSNVWSVAGSDDYSDINSLRCSISYLF